MPTRRSTSAGLGSQTTPSAPGNDSSFRTRVRSHAVANHNSGTCAYAKACENFRSQGGQLATTRQGNCDDPTFMAEFRRQCSLVRDRRARRRNQRQQARRRIRDLRCNSPWASPELCCQLIGNCRSGLRVRASTPTIAALDLFRADRDAKAQSRVVRSARPQALGSPTSIDGAEHPSCSLDADRDPANREIQDCRAA